MWKILMTTPKPVELTAAYVIFCLSQFDQLQELAPCFGVVFELSEHAGGDRLGVDLLDPSHDHAHVGGLDDHAHTRRVHRLHHGLSNLASQPLLNLKREMKKKRVLLGFNYATVVGHFYTSSDMKKSWPKFAKFN